MSINQRKKMKKQTIYHGGENKKVKVSKADKVYLFMQAQQRKALAATKKPATT